MTKKEQKIELINMLLDAINKAHKGNFRSADIYAYGLAGVADYAQVIHVERKATFFGSEYSCRYYLQFLSLPHNDFDGCRMRCRFDDMNAGQREKVAAYIRSLQMVENTWQFNQWYFTAVPAGMKLNKYYGFRLVTSSFSGMTYKPARRSIIETLATEKPANSRFRAYAGGMISLIWCDSERDAETKAAQYPTALQMAKERMQANQLQADSEKE